MIDPAFDDDFPTWFSYGADDQIPALMLMPLVKHDDATRDVDTSTTMMPAKWYINIVAIKNPMIPSMMEDDLQVPAYFLGEEKDPCEAPSLQLLRGGACSTFYYIDELFLPWGEMPPIAYRIGVEMWLWTSFQTPGELRTSNIYYLWWLPWMVSTGYNNYLWYNQQPQSSTLALIRVYRYTTRGVIEMVFHLCIVYWYTCIYHYPYCGSSP